MTPMQFLEHYWWLIIFVPGMLMGLAAQAILSSAYGRYSQVATSNGMTGADAAREILDRNGLRQVAIREVGGHLTDHYDPRRRELVLSSANFHGNSLAAVGVAAHEAGHALQHGAAYAPLHMRMALVPITNIANNLAYLATGFGLYAQITQLAWLGVIGYGIMTLFNLITLPVEYDASSRAKAQLLRLGLIDPRERSGVGRVLHAAALTYVAAMIHSLVYLLHFVMMLRRNNRR